MNADPLALDPDDDMPPLSPEDAIWTANQMYQPRVAEAIARLCAENARLRAEVDLMREEKAARATVPSSEEVRAYIRQLPPGGS